MPIEDPPDAHRTSQASSRRPDPNEWAIITNLFDRLSPSNWQQRDAALAGSDCPVFIADQVRAMLMSADGAGILDGTLDWAAPDLATGYASLTPGTVVGRFRIERLIGRGGAGEVYLAERIDGGFAQCAALKLLRPEAVGHMASFNAERSLLATLEHPGIARLIDGGSAPDGRPYMALEYVEGEPVTAWCASHQADCRTRLRLFVEICEAVAYAHARLIVHRDIKPSNVLIDGAGRARLLDFGIATLIGDALGGRGVTGRTVMLTPDYAAPEQLENGATTIATDVYALGALLFELLVGGKPWDVDGARLPSMLRRILDEDPPVPSRAAAAARGGSPVLPGRIAGDLDAIVLKAMRRMPEKRYASVGTLADEVRRHLSLRPVEARNGSMAYHMARFARRYRWAVSGIAAAVLALLIGAGGIAWQARRTAIERDAALAHSAQLEAVNQAMLLMFGDVSDPGKQRSTSVRAMIDGANRHLVQSVPPDSPAAGPTVAALADLYIIMESNADAKALLTGALAHKIGHNDPVYAARIKLKLGRILAAEGQVATAQRLLAEAGILWRTDPIRFRRERVETAGAEAEMLRSQGKGDEAIKVLSENMRDAEEVYRGDERDLSSRYISLISALIEAGRLSEAATLVATARAAFSSEGPAPSPNALDMLRLQAEVSARQGDLSGAAAALTRGITERRRYYGRSIELSVDLLRYARLLIRQGRADRALPLLALAAPMAIDHLGASSQPSIQIRVAQVEALATLGRSAEGQAIFAEIPPQIDQSAGRSLWRARYLRSRAALYVALGQPDAAATTMAAALTAAAKMPANLAYFRAESAELQQRIAHARQGLASQFTPTLRPVSRVTVQASPAPTQSSRH